MPPLDNTTPAASGEQPDSHLGELTLAAALLLLTTHAAEALRFEHAAALAASMFVRSASSDLLAWSTRLWMRRFGSLTTPIDPIEASGLVSEITHRLNTTTPPDPAGLLERQARQAVELGARQGAADLGGTKPITVELAQPTLRLAEDATIKVRRRYDDTQRLLATQPITTHADIVTALAPTQAAAGDVDTASRSITNTALNQGLADTAAHHGADLLWFAEPDACVVCLALSGEVVAHDEDFDPDLTFGRKPTPWYRHGTYLRPPRHPRCRCRVEPYYGQLAGGGPVSLPMALKREAARSVIKGWALESEPDSVRRDAAARLLARGGANLPKSVQARARYQVDHATKFKRPVPTGDG